MRAEARAKANECYLVMVSQSSSCKICKVIKLLQKNASNDSGIIFYDNYNLLL